MFVDLLLSDFWYFLTRLMARIALIVGISLAIYQGFLWLHGIDTVIGTDAVLKVLVPGNALNWLESPGSARPVRDLIVWTPASLFLLFSSWILDRFSV